MKERGVNNGVNIYTNWRTDLYRSIKSSEKFIYIAVPSLNPNMLLLLNNEEGGNKCLSIGELLKEKQQQGNEMRKQINNFSIFFIFISSMTIDIRIFTT